jgi:hypothetical protein
MMDTGLVSDRIDTSFLSSDLTAGSLFDENWLFAYEMISKKWLKPNKPRIVKKDPFFRILHENKVTFYEQGRQMEDAQTFLKGVPKKGVKPRIEHFVEEY